MNVGIRLALIYIKNQFSYKKNESIKKLFLRLRFNIKNGCRYQGSPSTDINSDWYSSGIIFAAMTFLMQSETQITFPHWLPNFMGYKEVLIGGFAIVGVLLILSTVGMITIAAGVIENLNYVNIMEVFAALSYYSLIALISILVIPFSVVATIIIVVIEIFWVVVFNKYAN